MIGIKDSFEEYILSLQDSICTALEELDGVSKFKEDKWERAEGGGGRTRVIVDGPVLEKGGVNTSIVHGALPKAMQDSFGVPDSNFYACGLSLVLHPRNPHVPTVHANWRYFELYNKLGERVDSWFGGGTDLTPYYLIAEDAVHFHATLKRAMDPFGFEMYPKYKRQCDDYFTNKHRGNEMRGIGGVFYDYLRPHDDTHALQLLDFQRANGNSFLEAYMPIAMKRKDTNYTEEQVLWQEIRRGRYVEFNLVHDRGTLFGLKTNGRTESILMSLPPRARWYYNYTPTTGSEEEKMMSNYYPKDWV